MSRTIKKIYKGKNKANPYGICQCVNCKNGRLKSKSSIIEKIKHKFRTSWKTNKEQTKGAYTD